MITYPQKKKLDSNITSHVCGLWSPEIKDSPVLKGQMVKGWMAQSALLL